MCGICGYYGFDDTKIMKNMLKSLDHRGPDNTGTYNDDNVSLGHTRLSVIDLSQKGNQPMLNEDGSIIITYNGEVYNFISLRKKLKNHTFISNTDTECIIHAYEEYGLNFLEKLKGMFSFAIYDTNKQRIILARDQLGKKPLYYYYNDELFIFASEIKAILEAKIKREVNKNSLFSHLAFQYTIGRSSLFKNIKKVLPGEMIIFDIKEKKVKIKRYWDIKENILNYSEQYLIKKLRNLLEESGKLRSISDVKIGAFLSGGLDSTTAIAILKPNLDYDINTFSMGFEEFSELHYANIVAEKFETNHHEIFIDQDNVIKDIKKIAWHYDEPMGDAGIIANYFLSKEAKKHVKVVIAGEGSDEIFGGYADYKIGLRIQRYSNLPQIVKKIFSKSISLIPLKERFHLNGLKCYFNYFSKNDFDEKSMYYIKEIRIKNELNKMSNTDFEFDKSEFVFSNNQIKNILNKMLVFDCKNQLSENYLMKADKATMAHSIEERLPLLDSDIAEFSFQIPPELKIKNNNEKYILKKAVNDLIPSKIINRKKEGFGVPYISWMQTELGDLFEDKIYESEFIKNFFNKNKVKEFFIKSKDSPFYSSICWNIFTSDLWYDQFF